MTEAERRALEQALALLREGLGGLGEGLDAGDGPDVRAAILGSRGLAAAAAGDRDRARRLFDEACAGAAGAEVAAWVRFGRDRIDLDQEDGREDRVDRMAAGVEALARAGHARVAETLAEGLVRDLRRHDVGAAVAVGDRLVAAFEGSAALHLRLRVAETVLLGQDRAAGEALLQAVEAEAGEEGWRLRYDAAIARTEAARADDDPDRAAHHAEHARSLAVAARDPGRYLGAAQTLANLAEARGDRLGAFGHVARAARSLQALDPSLASTGDALFQSLRQRWGEDDYAAVARAWVQRGGR